MSLYLLDPLELDLWRFLSDISLSFCPASTCSIVRFLLEPPRRVLLVGCRAFGEVKRSACLRGRPSASASSLLGDRCRGLELSPSILSTLVLRLMHRPPTFMDSLARAQPSYIRVYYKQNVRIPTRNFFQNKIPLSTSVFPNDITTNALQKTYCYGSAVRTNTSFCTQKLPFFVTPKPHI